MVAWTYCITAYCTTTRSTVDCSTGKKWDLKDFHED